MTKIVAKESTLASDLLISERRVRELFKEQKVDLGKYDYRECIKKYLNQIKGDTENLVSLKTLADVLGITEKTVRNLTKQKIFYKNENQKYDMKESIKSFLSKEGNDIKRIKLETDQFRLKILKEEYCSVKEVENQMAELFLNFRSKLLNTSKKIVIEFENSENKNLKEIIDKEISTALLELKNYKQGD